MSIYVISDLHLSFAPGNDKAMDIFGPRWFNHAERIGINWRQLVKDEDTVIVPGDISWGLKLDEAAYDLSWIDQLPGKKIMMKGNHDLWWQGIGKLNRMYDTITFLQNDSLIVENKVICGTRGWDTPDNDGFTDDDMKVYKRELLRLEMSLVSAKKKFEENDNVDEIICFMHYPPVSKVGSYSGFQQLFEDYGIKRVYYGHVHNEIGFKNTIQGQHHGVDYKLVSADYLNCMPILIEEV
ncbi:MAG: metallophosphoesterase [Firmicutes bacterium]|nr:metallophosphoesterase [Bacillota bacterium]